MIGLAKRAGKLAAGTENALEAIRKHKAKLVLVCADVSDNTKKALSDKSAFYGVKCEQTDASMAEVGRSIGKKSCAAIAFTDDNFVTAYRKSLTADNT
ncbi:MAG: ribosomal L7Ae/L30e/S12e/Gadd45 family protein [Clostridia bacterium]|nr:ribosomal L7Ae/L30e/S12e/Gadd45 family protein [Clostridia bacterium]